jgi:hypothetical protein
MSKSRAERDASLVRGGRNRGRESKKSRRWEELRASQEKRKGGLHAEKQACPRRGDPTAVKRG